MDFLAYTGKDQPGNQKIIVMANDGRLNDRRSVTMKLSPLGQIQYMTGMRTWLHLSHSNCISFL